MDSTPLGELAALHKLHSWTNKGRRMGMEGRGGDEGMGKGNRSAEKIGKG